MWRWFSRATAPRFKVFCIGRNKTGTTSVGYALKDLGFRLGDQAKAELLVEDWAMRDFRRIIRYCRKANAFQDVPFSLPDTFKAMDEAFPGSKFILTVRDSAREWYESLTRFHTKIVGKGRLPTAGDLKCHHYRYKGFLWRSHQLVYGIDESTLYDFDIYTKHYEEHNRRVIEYFVSRPDDLLVLNLKDPSAMRKLCDFLGIDYSGHPMPHLNKS